MATRESDNFTMLAGSDLTGKEGCFGKQSAGKVIPCSVLGERADVVIMSETSVVGGAADVAPRAGKIVIVKVGAVAVAQDAELTPDANGLAKTAVSTNVVRARALQAGNPGVSIRAAWVDAYIKP
jgi:hypothetical protein